MKKLKLFALAILAMGVCMNLTSCSDDDDSSSSKPEVYKEITVTTAGTLESLLGNDIRDVTSLKISGPLNGDDILILRELCDCDIWEDVKRRTYSLTSIDLSDATIVEGGGAYYYDEYYTSNDEIGVYFLYRACYLKKIILPKSITSIGKSAFAVCTKLIEITIPESVTSIEERAFEGCYNLTQITIPEFVTDIGSYAFDGCSSITEITIPEGVTSINNGVFMGCSSLTEIIIPKGVTSIVGQAFQDCSNLTKIYCLATEPPDLGEYTTKDAKGAMFRGISSDAILYVPQGTVDAYKNTVWGNNFTNIEEMQ